MTNNSRSTSRRSRRALSAISVAAVSALALAACGSTSSQKSAEQSAPLKVMASFYPLQFVTEQIAGSHAEVADLTPKGGEPHDLELTPKDVAEMSKANLVVYLGGFQASVDKAVAESHPKNTLDVAPYAHLVAADPNAVEDDDDDHDGDKKDGDSKDGEKEEHHKLAFDPHFWLNPMNLLDVSKSVLAELKKLSPNNAAEFDKNFQELSNKLTAINDNYKQGLKSCKYKTIVTAHTAFGYLATAYGLKQMGISGIDPEQEPSPARIAEIQKQIKETDATTIFSEELLSPKVAETIASQLHLKSEVLNPIESLSDGQNYYQAMDKNLGELKTALDCQ